MEKAVATHSSTLARKIPWTEEPGRLQSMGSQRVGQDWVTSFTFHFHALEKEMATHSSILARKIPWTEEPGGLQSMGSHRVRQDWGDLAAAGCPASWTGQTRAQRSASPAWTTLSLHFHMGPWRRITLSPSHRSEKWELDIKGVISCLVPDKWLGRNSKCVWLWSLSSRQVQDTLEGRIENSNNSNKQKSSSRGPGTQVNSCLDHLI